MWFVCFALFILSDWDFPNHRVPGTVLGTIGNPPLVSPCMHWGDFKIFKPAMQELLNFEYFYCWKFNKSQNNFFKGNSNWWIPTLHWIPTVEEDSCTQLVSKFSDLWCKCYWILSSFCNWKFTENQKSTFDLKLYFTQQNVQKHIYTL